MTKELISSFLNVDRLNFNENDYQLCLLLHEERAE